MVIFFILHTIIRIGALYSLYSNCKLYFQVLDYIQYYLDLSAHSHPDQAEWTVEYNLTNYYGLWHVSPNELHELAETFIIPEGLPLFLRYTLTPNTVTQNVKTNWFSCITNVYITRYTSNHISRVLTESVLVLIFILQRLKQKTLYFYRTWKMFSFMTSRIHI